MSITKIECISDVHFHYDSLINMSNHQMFSTSQPSKSIIMSILGCFLSSNSSPTNALATLFRRFCPCGVFLIWDCVVVTSLGPKGGGGPIGALFHPLNLLINVTIPTIHGLVWILTFQPRSKYVLKSVVFELNSWAWLLINMILLTWNFASKSKPSVELLFVKCIWIIKFLTFLV